MDMDLKRRFKKWLFRRLVKGYIRDRYENTIMDVIVEEAHTEYREDNHSTLMGHLSVTLEYAGQRYSIREKAARALNHCRTIGIDI